MAESMLRESDEKSGAVAAGIVDAVPEEPLPDCP